MTPDQPILDFVARHQYLLLASSVVGLGAAAKKVGSCAQKLAIAALRSFHELHGAYYDCRIKCAENRRRFKQATGSGGCS
jgi:hypothetical protein